MNTASILDTTPALDTNKLFHHFGSIYKDSESDFTLCVPAWVKALKESREQRFAYDERINRVISRLHDIARTVEDESKILTGISRQTDDLTVKAMKNEERWNMYFLAKDDAYEALQRQCHRQRNLQNIAAGAAREHLGAQEATARERWEWQVLIWQGTKDLIKVGITYSNAVARLNGCGIKKIQMSQWISDLKMRTSKSSARLELAKEQWAVCLEAVGTILKAMAKTEDPNDKKWRSDKEITESLSFLEDVLKIEETHVVS